MGITDFLGLLGGLALFLYGMQMMSNGLEAAAGNRMKQILEKLTANRFLGVAVGVGITAVIQSSSATTVMVVGFVNSGMMTLNQAVWIIILPDSKQEPEQVNPLFLLMDDFDRVNGKFGYSAIHLDMLGQEINKMLTYAKENVERGFLAVIGKDMEIVESMEKTEDQIDYLNKEISQYISKILIHDRSGQDIATIEEYFLITGNVERIGDHALNIGGYVKTMEKHDITFSQDAKDEIYEMKKITQNALETVMHRDEDKMKWLSKVAAMEQQMDDMTESYRNNHLERMRQGKCSEEACVLYSEMLTDFERIGDHLLNIAQSYSKMTITV